MEFGEKVWYRLPPARRTSGDLAAMWELGTWLGKRWGTTDNIIGIDGDLIETRCIQKVPLLDRWDRKGFKG